MLNRACLSVCMFVNIKQIYKRNKKEIIKRDDQDAQLVSLRCVSSHLTIFENEMIIVSKLLSDHRGSRLGVCVLFN